MKEKIKKNYFSKWVWKILNTTKEWQKCFCRHKIVTFKCLVYFNWSRNFMLTTRPLDIDGKYFLIMNVSSIFCLYIIICHCVTSSRVIYWCSLKVVVQKVSNKFFFSSSTMYEHWSWVTICNNANMEIDLRVFKMWHRATKIYFSICHMLSMSEEMTEKNSINFSAHLFT